MATCHPTGRTKHSNARGAAVPPKGSHMDTECLGPSTELSPLLPKGPNLPSTWEQLGWEGFQPGSGDLAAQLDLIPSSLSCTEWKRTPKDLLAG